MRKLLSLLGVLTATLISVQASSYTFTPSPSDLYDLDHHNAYSWGIDPGSALYNEIKPGGGGLVITSVTLKINDITNWDTNANKLFFNLLDDPFSGVKVITDDSTDTTISNYFTDGGSRNSGTIQYTKSQYLTFYTDTNGVATTDDYVLTFSEAQRNLLASFITDTTDGSGRVRFGLGFDPDCHYYNSGIELCITTGGVPTQTSTVPDGGSTAAMLGLALLGAGALHARLRKVKPAVA